MLKKHKKKLTSINILILGITKRNKDYLFCNLKLKNILAYALYKISQKENKGLNEVILDCIKLGYEMDKKCKLQ